MTSLCNAWEKLTDMGTAVIYGGNLVKPFGQRRHCGHNEFWSRCRGGELSIINTHLVAQLRATSVNCRLSALFQVVRITSQAMTVSVRIIQQMRIGFLLAEQGKVKPFANVL